MKLKVYNSVSGAAFFLRLLAEWRESGAVVTLHEAVTETEYRASCGLAGRLWLRWRMYGGFAWSSWRAVRRNRHEGAVHLCTTNPFFLPALVARAAGGRTPTINLLYDLYPEALIQAGKTGADSWLARRCAAITRYSLRECAVTVFLGEHLRAYAEAAYGPARRAEIIPVGADGEPFKAHPPLALNAGQSPRILYCGQMGRMHDVDTLLAIWGSEEAAACDWVFHASGAGYGRLRAAEDRGQRTEDRGQRTEDEGRTEPRGGDGAACEAVPRRDSAGVTERGCPQGGRGSKTEVIWGKALPDAEWIEAMKQAQVALVTVAPGAERVVMPSKTYSALVAGQAVLAICPGKSDLADLVRKHDCGWVVEPGDSAGLRAILREIAGKPVVLQAKRERAFAAGHAFYDSAVLAKQWLALFTSLAVVGR